jgi:ABC-type Fe3+-hydroxamate transport system substrate-binding protein
MGKTQSAKQAAGSQRIVSLAPNASSIIVALGARRALVGVSRWCADVADVSGLPRLGDCWAIDIKSLERLRPDLIVGSVPFKPEVVSEILRLPASFLALNPRNLKSIYSDVRILARLTGRALRGETLIRRMRSAFGHVASRAAHARYRPRVYAEAWPHPRITSPPWVAELVSLAGREMILPAGQRVTDQDIAAARPDVMLLAWTAAGARSKTSTALRNPHWRDVPAVRARRVFAIRDELVNTPGPPLIEGAQEILLALHPELA